MATWPGSSRSARRRPGSTRSGFRAQHTRRRRPGSTGGELHWRGRDEARAQEVGAHGCALRAELGSQPERYGGAASRQRHAGVCSQLRIETGLSLKFETIDVQCVPSDSGQRALRQGCPLRLRAVGREIGRGVPLEHSFLAHARTGKVVNEAGPTLAAHHGRPERDGHFT